MSVKGWDTQEGSTSPNQQASHTKHAAKGQQNNYSKRILTVVADPIDSYGLTGWPHSLNSAFKTTPLR